jgi:HlyD family secretion protein
MKTVFPRDILEHTAEVHYFRFGKRGMHIYVTLICALLLAIGSLPLIKVDVYTSSGGIIKPNSERYPVVAIVDGLVMESHISDNQFVQKGDTLLVINCDVVNRLLQQKNIQKAETEALIHDLTILASGKLNKGNLITEECRRDLAHFRQEVRGYKLSLEKALYDFQKDSILFHRSVIARTELEESRFALKVSEKELHELNRSKLFKWQTELVKKRQLYSDLTMNLEELRSKKNQYVILAPASGHLQNLRAQSSGSFISSGTVIVEISPDSRLYAECFVSTKDIGLIHDGLQVKFQIHAYNSIQWGLLNGSIVEIGNDIVFRDKTPFYKIRCQLEQDHLSIKNGITGHLKNGMTVTAHFKLAERTVWQLLYDKTEDWIQPDRQLAANQNKL